MKKVLKTRSRTGKAAPKLPGGPINSILTMAELSLQRGEFESARMLLEERVTQGRTDFKTRNLYGICLAHLRQFDKAESVLSRLLEEAGSKLQRARAGFNLGLVKFYRDLDHTGDLTVSHFNTLGMMRNTGARLPVAPFRDAIETWTRVLGRYSHRKDIVQAFLSFAHLQAGEYDQALSMVVKCQSARESFYISSYVTGRVFLDLYYLALEGHDLPFELSYLEFFEIEEYEIRSKNENHAVIHADTLLDIGMQAFLEARNLSPFCPEVLLNLCHAYLLAGMADETEEVLQQLEGLLPNNVAVLELALRFHQSVLSPTSHIQNLVQQIKTSLDKDPDQRRNFILPVYFQT